MKLSKMRMKEKEAEKEAEEVLDKVLYLQVAWQTSSAPKKSRRSSVGKGKTYVAAENLDDDETNTESNAPKKRKARRSELEAVAASNPDYVTFANKQNFTKTEL